MKPEVEALAMKGRRSLTAAEQLLAAGHADFACSRAYYAMFYLAEAALLSRGLSYSRHSAVIGFFGQRFGKTGEVSKSSFESLRLAFDKRNLADYETGPLPAEDARALIEKARQFIDEVEGVLRRG